jgi:hypothetical protein
MIVFDFADIRSRMLGDDKPKPKKVEIDPVLAGLMLKESPARPGFDRTCLQVRLPDGTCIPFSELGKPHPAELYKSMRISKEEWRKIMRGEWRKPEPGDWP